MFESRIFLIFILIGIGFSSMRAQDIQQDSLWNVPLQEVILIGKKATIQDKQSKPLTSIDAYLEQSPSINMQRRGGYAWEPVLNSMSSERTLITIDGMRVFSACTDKMDPVTSYVEVSNLSEAEVNSGQQGNHHGGTIGGSINLKLLRKGFDDTGWEGKLKTGFESNSSQKILGATVGYSNKSFYVDSDVMFRDAGNYKAGKHEEIEHSQFRKLNFLVNSGFSWNDNKFLEASLIYDHATDVGYPALPMDVSSAKGLITSLKFEMLPNAERLDKWETKVYYNQIAHRMDDTKRPVVPIHMDMPGWTHTYGMYSKISGKHKKHRFKVDLNAFYNQSLAEMTMYPEDPSQKTMFMYTWPDVRTFYSGIALNDRILLSEYMHLDFSANLGNNTNRVSNDMGLESLRIFYPEMKKQENRWISSLASNFMMHKKNWEAGFGIAYGERAPTVTEGYGYYLFNSQDAYDYIGNPKLKKERSWEANTSLEYHHKDFKIGVSGSVFRIQDYIVGKAIPNITPMTLGAEGVKMYEGIAYANILNAGVNWEYKLPYSLTWKSQVTYNYGQDNEEEPLPLISPLAYSSSLSFNKNRFFSELSVEGNTAQTKFSEKYGEKGSLAYALLHFNLSYYFKFGQNRLDVNVGVENILDTYYYTFSDWNQVPRQGRNFFVNLAYDF